MKKKSFLDRDSAYFIADIGANHDGSLARAKKLIKQSAQSGANAVKFQHFKAETIVSDFGFKKIGKLSHQKKWKKSIFDVYSDASINNSWTKILKKECDKYKLDFLTSPYDLNYVDSTYSFVKAYKIGSGDITWKEIIEKIAKKKKPIILATGASTIEEVVAAVELILRFQKKLVLMQCNTNYTNEEKNFQFLNLNVLSTFKKMFKNKIILGLSDHTQGYTAVISAVTLGAKFIEKHFTDDNSRVGPDHAFAMNPKSWKKMVMENRKIEKALGDGKKIVEKNEYQSSIVQRRCIRVCKNLYKNQRITKNDLVCLRPAPKDSISPFDINKVIDKKTKKSLKKGDHLSWKKIN